MLIELQDKGFNYGSKAMEIVHSVLFKNINGFAGGEKCYRQCFYAFC